MKRASIIAIVLVIARFAVWTIPVSASQTDTPKKRETPPRRRRILRLEIQEVNEAFNLFKERDADGALKMLKKACAKPSGDFACERDSGQIFPPGQRLAGNAERLGTGCERVARRPRGLPVHGRFGHAGRSHDRGPPVV